MGTKQVKVPDEAIISSLLCPPGKMGQTTDPVGEDMLLSPRPLLSGIYPNPANGLLVSGLPRIDLASIVTELSQISSDARLHY